MFYPTLISLFLIPTLTWYAYKHPYKYLILITSTLPLYILRWDILTLPTTLLENILLAFFLARLIWLITTSNNIPLKNYLPTQKALLTLSLLLLVIALFQSLISPNQTAALGIFKAYFLEPIILFFSLLTLPQLSTKGLKNLLTGLLISMIWLSTIGLSQIIFNWGLEKSALNHAPWRIEAIYNTPNALSLYLGPLLFFFFSLHQSSLNLKNYLNLPLPYTIKTKHLLTLTLTISLLAVILTFSRGAWLALILSLITKAFLTYQKKTVITTTILSLLTLSLLFTLLPNFRNLLQTPQTTSQNWTQGDASTNLRLIMYQNTWEIIQKSPLTGSKMAGFSTAYKQFEAVETPLYPHNFWLASWVELGLLGLLTLNSIIILTLLKLYQYQKNSNHYKNLAQSIILYFNVFIIHGLVDVPYFKNDLATLFWIMITLSTVTLQHSKTNQTAKNEEQNNEKTKQPKKLPPQKSTYHTP